MFEDLLNISQLDSSRATLDDSASKPTAICHVIGPDSTKTTVPTSISLVNLDHAYSEKRRLSTAFLNGDEESQLTQSSISLSFSTDLETQAVKKRRSRGIYRADDVTNDEELSNYLERRKKNNVSSKASRANKRCYYNEMGTRSEQLKTENERFNAQIVLSDKIIQLYKDFMVGLMANVHKLDTTTSR